PTQDDQQGSWKHDARRLVEQMEQSRGARAEWIGVCCPGVAAADGRSIWWMMGKMEATMGFEWAPHLGRQDVVPVYNDAQAALLGELCRGAARGKRNAVLLTLGTGVGG